MRGTPDGVYDQLIRKISELSSLTLGSAKYDNDFLFSILCVHCIHLLHQHLKYCPEWSVGSCTIFWASHHIGMVVRGQYSVWRCCHHEYKCSGWRCWIFLLRINFCVGALCNCVVPPGGQLSAEGHRTCLPENNEVTQGPQRNRGWTTKGEVVGSAASCGLTLLILWWSNRCTILEIS